MDLTQLRLLQLTELLYPKQDEALNKLVNLVEKHEDADDGLPLSWGRGFWDSASHRIKVDEKTLKMIEGYLTALGVPYTKDEISIRVDKHNGTSRRYTGDTTKQLHFFIKD
jgi:hypothetical protein